jgi:DNA-binding beta-propeller fold protein YncE
MKTTLIAWLVSLFFVSHVFAGDWVTVNPFAAKQFFTLPSDLKFPEGITTNPQTGDVFVATFDVPNAAYNPAPTNAIIRYSASGQLLARTDFSGVTPLIGIKFNPHDNHIYVASLGDITGIGSKILRIPANFSNGATAEAVADIPFIGAPQDRIVPNLDMSSHNISFNTYIRVPNDIIFNKAGDLFVSDSFQGAVFSISNPGNCLPTCMMDTVIQDSLLATAGFPSFGANGLAFNHAESELYIANTGDDRILKLDLIGDKGISIFAESINGADGITFDKSGNLWVTANQADNIIALNSEGRIIAKLGDFLGIRANGTARGLLFPASLAISGNYIYVTNMAQIATATTGDEPEESVTRYTVAKLWVPTL